MGLPVLHVSRLVGGDGSGISDTADVQAARCMRAMGGAACEAAPMPLGRTARHLQATFGRRTWGGSRADPEALVGRFRAVGAHPLVRGTGSVSVSMSNGLRHGKNRA